ncbi:S-layer homology domain-containing protein [Subtercola endophyticus]|uniref:S-layer homology domain-containing protein n=1 Tax=Subtercola endophyticus TaxID=2895559 RepID=UPI001E60AEF0|nr:S-layer homology domain-containing protein [Subtercola endophyticus]UFS58620.1 S-layer homology domain-containing protein [Subtercola endophyticus]
MKRKTLIVVATVAAMTVIGSQLGASALPAPTSYTISGHVTLGTQSAGAGQATVTFLTGTVSGEYLHEVPTDASGNFSFQLPLRTPFIYEVENTGPGNYVPYYSAPLVWPWCARTDWIDPTGDMTGLDATLSPGSAIVGTVTNAAGKPLGDVEVSAQDRTSCVSPQGTLLGSRIDASNTDETGTYQLRNLAPSTTFDVLFWDDSGVYGSQSIRTSTGAKGESTTFHMVLGDSAFADVTDPTATFYPYIQWMAAKGLSTGSTNPAGGKPLFEPLDPISRQAFAAFLYRYSGQSFTPPATQTFADVTPSNPFYTAIEWMSAEGISTGTLQPSGKPLFEPDANISRQATAAFLGRYAGIAATPPTNQVFADVPDNATFANAIDWMGEQHISTGTPQGAGLPLFKPTDDVTRQEVAAFLYRYDGLAG